MAIKKFERRFCDRCHVAAEMPDDKVSRLWETISFPGGVGCAEIPQRADLCPDCRGSLIGWWREAARATKSP